MRAPGKAGVLAWEGQLVSLVCTRGGKPVKVPGIATCRGLLQEISRASLDRTAPSTGSGQPRAAVLTRALQKIELALAYGGGAAKWVYIPHFVIGGKIFHADFALHFRAGAAEPYDAELGLCAFILHVDQVAGFELGVDTLQSCAAAADGAQAGGLGEGTSVSVHAPDLYGKFHEDTRLAATIHS
jgi:hypothetical protein